MEDETPTVVVIDDSAALRSVIQARLRLSGLLRVVADGADGIEAIGLAFRHQPSLVLLDMSMPDMDGLDAIPGILAVSPETRIVIYSGFSEKGFAERARECGASAYIEKSIPIDRLAGKLVTVLRESQAAETGARPGALTLVSDEPPPDDVEPMSAQEQGVLNEHLERFSEVFEEAAIGMATMTLTGTIVHANRALGAQMLCAHEDLIGVDYGRLTCGQSHLLDAALEDINERGLDLVHIEHDVEGMPKSRVLATLAPVRDAKGQALYVFMQVQDITAQTAAEDELRRSEERFRLLVEAVEDYAIFMLTPEGIVASWNAGAQRSKGYRADEIIGQHFRTFYGEDDQRLRHPEHELEIALREGHYAEEGWRIRKDGSRFWANVLITAVFDRTGRHLGFAKVTRDETANRDARETLRRSEERFRLLVEAVGDYAIFMLDPNGIVVSWNAGAQRSKGYQASEIIGQHFRVFYTSEKQAAQHPEFELETALREGRYAEEGWRIRKDGSHFWAYVVITAVFNEAGEHLGFSKVTRDITERRLAEQSRDDAGAALTQANVELTDLNDRLQQAADEQSQFLAVTAHELRTPVGVLSGAADMLMSQGDELTVEERDALLTGMTASAGRLQRLLSDLLTAARLDANVLRMDWATVSLAGVVRAAVETARATHPQVQIHLEAQRDVDVSVDSDRLTQVIDNLLENALRHGEQPVSVAVGATGGVATVHVTDSGKGVDPEVRPRLFERFATGQAAQGSGLGLFIVRGLARALGGDATYESEAGAAPAGAFVVSLPRA